MVSGALHLAEADEADTVEVADADEVARPPGPVGPVSRELSDGGCSRCLIWPLLCTDVSGIL